MAEQQKVDDKRVVLLCLDGNDPANYAFDWYLSNVRQPRDYVYGVIVMEYNLSGMSVIKMVGPLADPQALSNEFSLKHKAVEKLCGDYTAKLRNVNCKGQVDQYSTGEKPGDVIIKMAEQYHADLIVMGSRGLSKMKKFLVGSVSNHVLHYAHCPVTIVPPPSKE